MSGAVTLRAEESVVRRHRRAEWFRRLCLLLTISGIAVLALLLFQIVRQGIAWLDWQFLTSLPSRHPERTGIKPALFGSLWMIALTASMSVPVGVAAALELSLELRVDLKIVGNCKERFVQLGEPLGRNRRLHHVTGCRAPRRLTSPGRGMAAD